MVEQYCGGRQALMSSVLPRLDNTLSTQLYAAVIKDGMNATAANRVMEMLARLPVESMHTCLTDDALRRRMVKRCLQKLAEGDVM
eukprot:gene5128-3547_t